MDALQKAVRAYGSGPALVQELEGAGVTQGPIPGLITNVIAEAAEARQQKPAANGAAANGAAPGPRASLDGALCVIDGLMFLSPRGKQQLALFKECLMVKTAKADVSVPWDAIRHVAIIDCIPGDTKGKVLLYLHVDSAANVMNGKTQITAVVIQTNADAQLDVPNPQGPAGARLQGPAPIVLCQALGAVPGGPGPACFVSPDPQYFQSADKAAGVKAHVKARDGFLYPLPSAFCFLEAPQLFIPHSQVASVEMMRAGGASSTFDLVIHLRGGRPAVEFGMIGRQEVGGIEDYIRKLRLAVGAAPSSDDEAEEQEEQAGQAGSGPAGSREGKEAAAEEEDEDSDDPEDEDFNPTSSSDEEEEAEGQEGGKQRSGSACGGAKRKRESDAAAEGEAAAGGAAAGNEDEEEDESEEEDEDESSSSEDDDDDGSVELVSEDEFSRGALESLLASEGGSGGRRGAKRQRGGAGSSG